MFGVTQVKQIDFDLLTLDIEIKKIKGNEITVLVKQIDSDGFVIGKPTELKGLLGGKIRVSDVYRLSYNTKKVSGIVLGGT